MLLYKASEWTAANPVLDDGLFGLELDTGRVKRGDGVTPWVALPYYISSFGRTLVAIADAAALRAEVDLEVGTDIQAYSALLAALAGLTGAANKLPYFTGASTASTTDFTAFGRSVAGAADATALNRLMPVAINPQTGTSYTAALTDAQGLVTMNNAAGNIFYIPTNLTAAFPIGTSITVAQLGAGQTSFAAVTPGTTTLRYAPGAKIATQYGSAVAIKIATDEWLILGSLAA